MPAATAETLPTTRHDWRQLLQLGWPILVAQLAMVGMGVTDTIMAGQVSAADLAAVAVGFSIYVPLVLSFTGILHATTARVAHAFGARDNAALTRTMQQSAWLALGLAAIGVVLLLASPWLMQRMAVDATVFPIATGYTRGVALGIPGALLFQLLRSFSEAHGRSKPVMVISVAALLINIPLNYIYIHGLFGMPALGGAGCGYATGTVQWLTVIALAFVLRHQLRPLLHQFAAPHAGELKALLALGLPIGGALFMEVSIFAIVALLIGHLGAETLAGHQIAINLTSMTFMVPASLAVALTVKVGQSLGAGQPQRARRFALLGAITGIAFGALTALGMVTLGTTVVAFYNDDSNVRQLAAHLLLFAACYQITDALQVTAAGSLRGYHDTRVTFIITIVAYWGIGLPLGYVLGLTDLLMPRLGVAGFWVGFIAGLSSAAVLLNIRLYRISRRPLRLPGTQPDPAHA